MGGLTGEGERLAKSTLGKIGYVALGLFAVVGVALSGAFLAVSTDIGRGLLVPRLVGLANGFIAGHIDLKGFRLLPDGGLELIGLRVLDPEQAVVLSLDRLRVTADLTHIRSKAIGLRLALDGPSVFLVRGADETLSLERALSPRRPSKPSAPGKFSWIVRVSEFTLHKGHFVYAEEDLKRFEAEGLEMNARGAYGPRGGRIELSLRGRMVAPQQAPLVLDAAAGLRGDEVRVRLLRAAVGDTALDLLAEGNLATRRGRLALLSLAVDSGQVKGLEPRAPLVGDLSGTLYAESDGKEASLALALAPKGQGGTARAAAAVRLTPSPLAAGAEIHLTALDLSRILRGAPETSLTLAALGRGRGKDLKSLEGNLALSLSASRLRGADFGPAEVEARADEGEVVLTKLSVRLPGAKVKGSGRYRRAGELAGQAVVEAADLGSLRRDLQALLGKKIPPVEGSARLEAHLSGSEALPSATLALVASRLAAQGVNARGVDLSATLEGPLASPKARFEGSVAALAASGREARTIHVEGEVGGHGGELHLRGSIPTLGEEPLEVGGKGELSGDGKVLTLSALSVAIFGSRYELEAPAHLDLQGPRVDRLTLKAGAERIALSGGFAGEGSKRALDAQASLASIDLARLPRALVPETLRLAGRLSAELEAKGRPEAPSLGVKAELANGSLLGVEGLAARSDLAWDGPSGRARVELEASRGDGGELHLTGEVPGRLARAPRTAPVEAHLMLRHIRVAEVLRLAAVVPPAEVDGLAALDLVVGGSLGEPTLTCSASVEQARYGDESALAIELHLQNGGKKVHFAGTLDAQGTRALEAALDAPLDLGALLRDPKWRAAALSSTPFTARLETKGLDLARFAGRFGSPRDLAGRLSARLDLSGTSGAPRGELKADLSNGVVAGYSGLSAQLSLSARETSTSLAVETALDGAPLARFAGEIALPLERMRETAARETAPIEARLEIPGVDLGRAGAPAPVAGELSGRASFEGNLTSPRLSADLEGKKLTVSGHPLGDLSAEARGQGHALEAHLHLAVESGGTLDGTLAVQAQASVSALHRKDIGRAPARATLVAKDLDLRFLPAVAPGLIRSAAGTFEASLTASGPLDHMLPRGEASLTHGQVSVIELGDLSGVEAKVTLAEDVVRVEELVAHRGAGSLDFKGEIHGLTRKAASADLTAELRAKAFDIPQAGQTLATLDLDANLKGKVSSQALEAEFDISSGRIKLPDLNPRRVQSLSVRSDIVVAPFSERPKEVAPPAPSRPYRIKVHVVAPNRLFVKSDKPVVDLELRVDTTAELELGKGPRLEGDVRVVRGRVEPVSGRSFDLAQGRVEFNGGGYKTGTLEVKAVYENTSEKVTVTVAVSGTIEKPEVALSSQPSLPESQIALLIATGHKELRADTGGVGVFDVQSAGTAALGTLSTLFFKDVVGDKLPVDMVSVDPSQLRAGKYVSERLYVGYTRRMNALTEEGENTNEVEADYQILPQLTFEVRYGDANSGGASLIWSKDY